MWQQPQSQQVAREAGSIDDGCSHQVEPHAHLKSDRRGTGRGPEVCYA